MEHCMKFFFWLSKCILYVLLEAFHSLYSRSTLAESKVIEDVCPSFLKKWGCALQVFIVNSIWTTCLLLTSFLVQLLLWTSEEECQFFLPGILWLDVFPWPVELLWSVPPRLQLACLLGSVVLCTVLENKYGPTEYSKYCIQDTAHDQRLRA